MGAFEDNALEALIPAPGTILAEKYRVERVLGKGGMGYVVAATHVQLDEPVAMKFLYPTVARDPDLTKRFLREAKAALKIRSEHVVRVLDVGTLPDTGAPFLVMEHLVGRDLDTIIKSGGPQPIATSCDLVLQACEALAEAHVQGMVHRDLKPANLFVTNRADGSPLLKVLDFGISKVTGAAGADLGMTKTDAAVMGSPLYMSPEQMRSMRSVDARTDIWALGIVLYELLAGRTPFSGSSLPELCAAILQDAPALLSIMRFDMPPALETAVLKCVEKDPALRFPNVGELALVLGEFATADGKTSAARVRGVLAAAGVTTGTQVMSPSGNPPPPSQERPSTSMPASGTPGPSSGQVMGTSSANLGRGTGTAWGRTGTSSTPNRVAVTLALAVPIFAILVGAVLFVAVPKIRSRLTSPPTSDSRSSARTVETAAPPPSLPSALDPSPPPSPSAIASESAKAMASAPVAALSTSATPPVEAAPSRPTAPATATPAPTAATPATTQSPKLEPSLQKTKPSTPTPAKSAPPSGNLFDGRK
jgi:serine/threonine-protein kinase